MKAKFPRNCILCIVLPSLKELFIKYFTHDGLKSIQEDVS